MDSRVQAENGFPAEASLDVRSQDGTLDLDTETGVAALKETGLRDRFLKDARFDGGGYHRGG